MYAMMGLVLSRVLFGVVAWCDTIIQVFDKDDLSHLHAFALKGIWCHLFNPEFMKSNTKEPPERMSSGSWITN